MYRLLRPLLFRMDPEQVHRLALRAARAGGPLLGRAAIEAGPVELAGLHFSNPVGLAAGYDKDGTAWRNLARVGFGHIEIGTVTPRPQEGNPRPRVFRIPEHRAVVNRMGFPGEGADAVATRLEGPRPAGLVLGISIGPNAATRPDERIGDYLGLVDRFASLADYLAVNVSSPNTPGLRDLEEAGRVEKLLGPITERCAAWREQLSRPLPLLVKLSPDLPDAGGTIAAAERAGVSGLILGNTTASRPDRIGENLQGGLSGAPLGPIAASRLDQAAAITGLPIIASGGIMNAADATARLDAGASLIQLYTGLIYAGPRLVRDILRARN